ncbi:type I-F CRISPR-associated protein Csy1 [Desulfonatronovibrio hydrogenovorans]|uniref:type I-F CRISPR-associated protein Csy1 n=1 Tax=Desulfonatronovibrio hydrogenovorans TaxID=53245 RepID=UPI0004900B5D|nr:type I-F CRISPR-associated protein Csy1 [Desulfonatronovibrio hydrogenovorans]
MPQTLEELAAQKKKDPGEMLRENLARELKNMMRPATHIGKYTHPQAKDDMSILCENSKCEGGYVCFGNFKAELKDYATGNAVYLPHSKTMEAMMQDGRTVREHLEHGSSDLQRIASVDEKELKRWAENFQEREKQGKFSSRTDFKLKQVYLPLENGQYRLMTLLPCSVLIWEMKSRINSREWDTRIENNKEYNVRISFVDHWVRKYGGTKPQNVSHLNNENGGNVRVLTCLPPSLGRDYELPKRNFFNQIRVYLPKNPQEAQKGVGHLFISLYSSLLQDPNTHWARRKKKGILRAIIERGVIWPAEKIISSADPGWSLEHKYAALPPAQKAWLDPYAPVAHEDDMVQSADWQEEIAAQISRFICRTFERMVHSDPQKKKIEPGEAFFRETAKLAKEYLDG